MRHLKVIGNYGPIGTKVIDEENGEEIPNVRKVTWTHEVGHAPICTIELVGVSAAAIGDDITSMDSPSIYREYKTTAPTNLTLPKPTPAPHAE